MVANSAGCLTDLDVAEGYSTSADDLLNDFYAPALSSATTYDRAVGYFSSGLIALAPLAFADFVSHGGQLRLVCSPHVSAQDAERLDAAGGVTSPDEIVGQLRDLATSDDVAAALTQVLSSLLHSGILELKFAHRSGGGLFHDKVGLLRDACGHAVSFVGSANETAAAWSGFINHEQIETFSAWQSDEQADRVRRHQRYFDEIWHGLARGLRVASAEKSAALIYEVSDPEAPEVSLERLRKLMHERSGRDKQPLRHLRPHQSSVLDAWRARGNRGIVAFATGGGKTLTAISAIRDWTLTGRPALVLVPSALLHKQWMKELKMELPDVPVLSAGAASNRQRWVDNVAAASVKDESFGPRVILSTYATAVSSDFRQRLREGEHLLLVADEVHRMGAPDARALFEIEAGGRLALSATPERYGDATGTAAIFSYFGQILQPEFGIREAIAVGQLVPYDYFLETVALDDDEMEAWDKLSREIAQEVARNDGAMTERAVILARDRAKILKSASAKAEMAAAVLQERFVEGDRWLVYCDDLKHLRSVRSAIERRLNLPVFEYHSRNSVLGPEIFQHFGRGGILLAIKCLDEGVDLPFINRALILASTANPREYIQRRGRVLRRSPDKYFAQIVDVAVTDAGGELLSLTEAIRAEEFAGEAQNRLGLFRLQALRRSADARDRWRRDDLAIEQDLTEVDDVA